MLPVTTTMLVIGALEPENNLNFTIKGSDLYVEDFMTDTFEDDPASSTFGWGRGYLSSDRNFSFNPLDFYATAAPVIDLEFQGRRCFALTNDKTVSSDQVYILDVTNPSSIAQLGSTTYNTNGTALDVDGAYFYTGQHHSAVGPSFCTGNAIDPTSPAIHWTYGQFGQVTDIESEGRYVYYTIYKEASDNSFKVFDAEDPTSMSFPSPTGWVNGNGLGLTVEGRLAYVAASIDGLFIFNISNPYNTVLVGQVDTPGNATDVLVDGSFAYVTDGDAGIQVVDILDPTQPEIIGTYDTAGITRRMAKQGNTLFVSDGPAGFTILDVADPFNPVLVISVVAGYTYDVALYGGIIGAATETGVYTFSIASTLSGITGYNRNNFLNIYNDHEVWDVKVRGNIAYIAGGSDGFYTLDVRYPEHPVLLDIHNPVIRTFKKLDIDGQYAYLVDNAALYVYDISDPSNIRLISLLGVNPGHNDIFSEGHTLYMAWGGGTMPVLNNSHPAILSWSQMYDELTHGTNITSVWAQGRHAYTVDNSGVSSAAIFTHSALDLTAVTTTDSYTGMTIMKDIFVDGEVAYTANVGWIITFDINDPTNIIYGDSPTTPAVYGVHAFGQYLMTADRVIGLTMYDASNIYSLTPFSGVSELTNGLNVFTHGDYTYYANQTSLSILRHYESAGDTYENGIFIGQSLEVDSVTDGLILDATLDADMYVPPGTTVDYQMSADGGLHWEDVTPGILHEFVNTGENLRWRAIMTGIVYRSAHIYEVSINYNFNLLPTTPTIEDLGVSKFTGIFTVKWTASTDDVAVEHYELQMSDTSSFTTILKSWTPTKTKQAIFGLAKDTYYFRARAIDDTGLPGYWSVVEQVEIKLSTLITGIIFGSGLLVIVVVIVVISIVIRKKKKIAATR